MSYNSAYSYCRRMTKNKSVVSMRAKTNFVCAQLCSSQNYHYCQTKSQKQEDAEQN
ncbi:MAG: hypothetical protein LBH98_01620 [Chitinispirillales bacterium]|nr:hypothetical protein [Chitinispirillales bacterium]